jgi:hypothetical protein
MKQEMNLNSTVKVNRDLSEVGVANNDTGIITAYLPDENTFAVKFNSAWVTFEETSKEEFWKMFNKVKE